MKIDIPAFKHCFIGDTSVLTVYNLTRKIKYEKKMHCITHFFFGDWDIKCAIAIKRTL